jgi:hypothetical protein
VALATDSRFRVHHALRIKGFVKVEPLAELAGVSEAEAEAQLKALEADGFAAFKEARGLWQLTKDGREAHGAALDTDVSRPGFHEGLAASYHAFLELNEEFKALCGDWQLRDGAPNDHSDKAYDRAVIDRLGSIDDRARPLCVAMGEAIERFNRYAPRLVECRAKLEAGDERMFTGVMCGSYHDVWMELHEDLILSQHIDRAAEGSF